MIGIRFILLFVLALCAFVSIGVGHAALSWSDLPSIFSGSASIAYETIFFELRLPRLLVGILVGMALGISGAAMQGLLRNPLAEPGVIGVSGTAGLGAVVVFYSGIAGVATYILPLGGMLGALLAVALLYGLTRRGASTQTLILAGVAINAFAGAVTALVLNLSSNPFAAYEIVFWLMGSLTDRSIQHVYLCALPIALGLVLVLSAGRHLDALTLGEMTAKSLGVNLARLRFQIIVGTALMVGAAVAVSGMVGFVGLVVPHILRPWFGHRPSRLLFWSGVGGAIMVLLADMVVRWVPTLVELKLGVVTAMFGAPFFLVLIQRLRRTTN